jgi:pSer/pThr/pTyr-binding forkhead associated (FHA) protein
MICVLDVIDGPARGKRIWLKENECLEVGRIATADFPIPMDSHLSRRHLLLDSTQNSFRVRDVGSANGTFLNNSRITIHELRDGDTLRAGMTTFLVTFRSNGENPHQRDGISFSQTATPASESSKSVESGLTVCLNEQYLPNPRTLDFSDRTDLESTVQITQEEFRDALPTGDLKDLETTFLQTDLPPVDLIKEPWWKSFFIPTETTNLYEQSEPFVSSQGDFVGLLKKLSKEYRFGLIVNQSQLGLSGLDLLERLRATGGVALLSRTLCYFEIEQVVDPWSFIRVCMRQDAFVCIGNKRTPSLKEFAPYANSVSYPSMLMCHLRDPSSDISRWILGTRSVALFEMDRDGKIGLYIAVA